MAAEPCKAFVRTDWSVRSPTSSLAVTSSALAFCVIPYGETSDIGSPRVVAGAGQWMWLARPRRMSPRGGDAGQLEVPTALTGGQVAVRRDERVPRVDAGGE